ncbi:phosphotransferase family protein [Aspergillus affinis]|uniref:phosphotransferase family protein n=1 Tax=Aspergillus affinis TaxID=1070780 RepID=UPI0022FEB12B|nr:uncharacterized protein KD926_009853 [Aspergillus affinis]KAI9039219.1 hypothetical protein KD926_009853 [Aspergillus affinis]
MQDGSEVVVKIPNPNAGPSHYVMASEVATMQYARESLQLPVPRVLSYCSHASESRLGTEYIVMEKARGIELSRKWDTLKGREKLSIVKQIASIGSTLSRAEFPFYGALYRQEDVSELESMMIDETFAIGPLTGRSWHEDERGEFDVYKGPWFYPADFIRDMALREKGCVEKFFPLFRDRQQGFFNWYGDYRPTKEAKLSALNDFLQIFKNILPISDLLKVGTLWHGDLHGQNIFVDHDDPTKITSIIDWQTVSIYPKFFAVCHPSLIEFDGPKPEQFVMPTLPEGFEDFDVKQKKVAKELYLAQILWLSYELQVSKDSSGFSRVFEYQDSLQAELLRLIGAVFDGGEPYIQRLLAIASRDEIWPKVVGEDDDGNPKEPCPLYYSQRDLETQDQDFEKWARDIERKQELLDEVGVSSGWDGDVPADQYDELIRRLDVAKERFLNRASSTPEERALWEKTWPFQDKTSS